jgi:YbbR domain-containing protein
MKRPRVLIVFTTLLLGTFLWLSVSLREQFTVSVDAPLTIEDVPVGMAIRSAVPRHIQMKLRGEGWRLAGLFMGSALKVNIPYASLTPGNHIITINQIVERIALSPGIQLLRTMPNTVAVWLDRTSTKRVPVVPDVAFSFREGYGQVGPVQLIPDSVTMTGAETVLRQIAEWKTAHVEFADVKGPIETMISVAHGDGPAVQCVPPELQVRVNIQPFAEKVFTGLPVEITGTPPNREVIFIPPKMDVVARGGIRQLASLMPVDFRVVVPFDRILADTTGTVLPDVHPPAGIQIVTHHPEKLQYIVRKRL